MVNVLTSPATKQKELSKVSSLLNSFCNLYLNKTKSNATLNNTDLLNNVSKQSDEGHSETTSGDINVRHPYKPTKEITIYKKNTGESNEDEVNSDYTKSTRSSSDNDSSSGYTRSTRSTMDTVTTKNRQTDKYCAPSDNVEECMQAINTSLSRSNYKAPIKSIALKTNPRLICSPLNKGRAQMMEMELKLAHDQAMQFMKAGVVDKAESHFKEILNILINEYGSIHPRVGTAFHNIGILHSRNGTLEKGLDAMDAAVRIRMVTLGKTDPNLATSLVELGIVQFYLTKFDQSIQTLNEALEIREREALKVDDEETDDKRLIILDTAKVLNNMGCVYFEYGDLDYAHETFDDALEMQREIHQGKNYKADGGFFAMASTLCNLAYTHLEQNSWEQAIAHLEEALEIQKALIPLGNKVIMNTLEHLAFSLTMLGNHDKAIITYKDILHLKDHKKCQDNKEKLKILINIMKALAYNYMQICDYEKTLEYLEEIASIQEHEIKAYTQLDMTKKLIDSVHYQMFKFPGPVESVSRALKSSGMRNPLDNTVFQCECGEPDLEELDLRFCIPNRPPVTIKILGHKICNA